MNIGEPRRIIEVEPIEEPWQEPGPPEPNPPIPEKTPDPEKVPT